MTESEDFFRHLSVERGLSKNTCSAYAGDAKAFIFYCEIRKLDYLSLKSEEVEGYFWHLKSDLKLKASTLFRKMESIRSFFRYLALEGKIEEDPTKNFKTPRLKAAFPDFLSKKEMEKLLSFPRGNKFRILRTATAIELFYASGMRISELLGLRLESVNLDQRWIRVTGKGSKERIIPINSAAADILKIYIEFRESRFALKGADDELFVGRSGRRLSRVAMWKDINKFAKLTNLDKKIHPHLFRHTFASHLLQGGSDLRSLQEMLGHASLNTTQIYTHIQKSESKNAHKKFHPDKGI